VSGRVLVVGAGPVGLFLGALLRLRGLEAVVIDRREGRWGHSRAIGVHPPGVAALEAVGVVARVRAGAVRLRRVRAVGVDGPLATVDLSTTGEVLTVPQPIVEAALEARLRQAGDDVLRWRHELVALRQDAYGVDATVRTPAGERTLRADVVVGCDGRHSCVRRAAGIGWRGAPYPDRYVMADLPATAELDGDCLLHLHPEGVVESFPLANGRRWVAHLGREPLLGTLGGHGALERLKELVRARTGWPVPESGGAASEFAIERGLAARLARGRVALAGDAGHVLSPIGGQGMNLGWLDALALADALAPAATGPAAPLAQRLDRYDRERRRRARAAIVRAEVNTRLGRPHRRWRARLRDAVLARALLPPFAHRTLGLFTMRGLA
jgi:2-polyprenyl-6-methoxyphenol hydroxylase-like FAD-dependent oxidoreductase